MLKITFPLWPTDKIVVVENENPYKYLKEFHVVCSSMKP